MLEMLLAGGKKKVTGMSYSDFVIWLNNNKAKYTALTTSPAITTSSSNYQNAYVSIAMTADGGNMWGTPYNNWFTHDSPFARFIRHSCPIQSVFDYMLANKQFCLIKLGTYISRPSFLGINRNGYNSISYSTFGGRQLIDFIYHDNATGIMMRWNPSIASTPVVFDGTLV